MMFEPLPDSFGPVRHETGRNFTILQYQADQIQDSVLSFAKVSSDFF